MSDSIQDILRDYWIIVMIVLTAPIATIVAAFAGLAYPFLHTRYGRVLFDQFAMVYDLQSLGITYTQKDVIKVDDFSPTDQFFDKEELQSWLSVLINLNKNGEIYFLKNWDEYTKSQLIEGLIRDTFSFGDSIKGPLTFEEVRTLFQKLNCFVVFNNLKLEPILIELIRKEYLDNYRNLPIRPSYMKFLVTLFLDVQYPSRAKLNRIFDLILKNLNKESIDSELCPLNNLLDGDLSEIPVLDLINHNKG